MAADRDLLFGLFALQIGLVNQDQLLGAFREWTRDSGTDKQNLAYGILLVVTLLVVPGGLADPRIVKAARSVRAVVRRPFRRPRPATVESSAT